MHRYIIKNYQMKILAYVSLWDITFVHTYCMHMHISIKFVTMHHFLQTIWVYFYTLVIVWGCVNACMCVVVCIFHDTSMEIRGQLCELLLSIHIYMGSNFFRVGERVLCPWHHLIRTRQFVCFKLTTHLSVWFHFISYYVKGPNLFLIIQCLSLCRT